ncbi:mucin desulfatase [Spirochaetia bacterium]|nr:mucin desulfatase [Spirochaetia bacterium]
MLNQFSINGEFEGASPLGGGHINDTFLSRWNQAGTRVRYTHQRINDHVFIHPDEVMENIERITAHIAKKVRDSGAADWGRRTLTVIPARDGKSWVRDAGGAWWRTYFFIEETHTREIAASPEETALLGKSVGRFQKQLADLGGRRLHETIPDFHNMEKRYCRFYEALEADKFNRAADVPEEIEFMRKNEERGAILVRSVREGRIPERICHNDAKMNNILLDDETGEALCLIDLDTVMPGSSLFDLGDLIRTAVSRAREDEMDLSKVVFDIDYFTALLRGYLSEASDFLIPEEQELLAEAGRNITQIMALRFLTDYLEGDHYYHITRPEHNRDRCRNQIALIRSMDSGWQDTERIAAELCGGTPKE